MDCSLSFSLFFCVIFHAIATVRFVTHNVCLFVVRVLATVFFCLSSLCCFIEPGPIFNLIAKTKGPLQMRCD